MKSVLTKFVTVLLLCSFALTSVCCSSSKKEISIPLREDIPQSDKWDLSSFYASDEEWEKDMASVGELTEQVVAFKGKLGNSSESLLSALKALEKLERVLDNITIYTGMIFYADQGNPVVQENDGRASIVYSDAYTETSFFGSEMLAIPEETLIQWSKLPEFADYRVFIENIIYNKQHILSEKEEHILTLAHELSGISEDAFLQLTNVDLSFEPVIVKGKEMPLTSTTYETFTENPDRKVRREAYRKYASEFVSHQNTLAAIYAGSVTKDVFFARARGFNSSLDAALYGEKIPDSVYLNLIDTVRANIEPLQRFYNLCKKVLKLDEFHPYDKFAPLVKDFSLHIPYEETVELCRNAFSPLGKEYTDILCNGLLNGWVDRYENQGKYHGAFTWGSYDSNPYILMNYNPNILEEVYTVAHEGGHSMHSWYSFRNNPYMCYCPSVFEAEVASTFNEELLFEYLLKNAESNEEKIYLLTDRATDFVSSLYKQTMLAEYELKAHEMVENGTPLNAQNLRALYRSICEYYYGSSMVLEPESDITGLLVPHFYEPFYVYQYATGISAALALAKRVTEGGEQERIDYINFLKSGGSRDPIESLRLAGVDMESPAPVQAALDVFKDLVDQLEELLL